MTTTVILGSEKCEDISGNFHSDNGLEITRTRLTPPLLNGDTVNPNTGVISSAAYDTPCDIPMHSPSVSVTSESIDWSSFLSLTNPSRPEVLLPVFIFELKDLPRMIRHAGRFLNGSAYKHSSGLSAAKEVASANLAYRFGWAPLVSDLKKLGGFSETVNKRRKELNRYYSGSGLKRSMTLQSSFFGPDLRNPAIHGNPFVMYPTLVSTATIRRWATVRWKPSSTYPVPIAPREFTRALLGLHRGAIAENLWEALPWSWLIDYFTNLGDLISSRNNVLAAAPPKGCIMTHIRYETVCQEISKPVTVGYLVNNKAVYVEHPRVLSSGSKIRETKTRTVKVGQGLPAANFPILSGGQLSILASLATLRVR